MYRLLKRYNSCSLADIIKDDSFFLVSRSKKENIQQIQHIQSDFSLIWESPELDVFSGIIESNEIKYSTLSGQLFSRSLINYTLQAEIKELQPSIPFGKWYTQKIWNATLLCLNYDYSKYVLVDLKRNSVIHKFNFGSKEWPILQFYQNRFIVKSKREGTFFPSILQIYDTDFQLIWQHDFTEDCRFIDYNKIDRDENERLPGQIEDIVLYGEDKLIVSCKYSKVFCIEILTGKILWENTFTGNREYIIVGDIGYAYSNGGGIHKIDLKTGASLHEDKRFHRLPEMPYYNNLHISTATDTIIYHDGLLWGLIYSNGYSFVVAIHPDTYQYEWIHRVETTEKVMSIQFYNDRMYLHTSGSELFIYEKH